MHDEVVFQQMMSEMSSRSLLGSAVEKVGSTASTMVPKWKQSLWDESSTDPAMLRVPIVVLTFIILFAFDVVILDRFKLQYHSVMSIKSVTPGFVISIATTVASIYFFCMVLLCNMSGFGTEFGIALFYFLVVLVCSLSILPGHESLNHFMWLLKITFVPGNSISFSEILTGDALTSLSKVLKDFGVTIVIIYSKFRGERAVVNHDMGMMLVAILASLPFALRVRQCSVQFMGYNEFWYKWPVFLNIMKYMTGFPPIWLTAASSFGYFHPSLPFATAVAATINSVYSFLWDIIMDWGLFSISREFKITRRPRLLLPATFHIIAAVVNLVLRFSWAANRFEMFATMHPSHFILLIEVAEVFRRAMWNIFRIEWEIIVKQSIMTVAKNTDEYSDQDDMIALIDRSQGKMSPGKEMV